MAMTKTSNPAVAETAVPSAGSQPRVQSVARAVSILVAVAESPDGLKAMEIAARVGLGRQGTYHLLHTLVGCRMLARNQQNRYMLGLQVAILSDAFVRHLAPPEHLAPLVRQVAADTRETAYAAGWRDGEIVNLVSAPGSNAIQAMTVPQGYHQFANARATGKLLLAFAAPNVRERYLATHDLEKRTPNTLSDRGALETELTRIQNDGFATDREEFAPGLCCLAVPVGRGGASFVIGISAPTDRFDAKFDEYLRILRRIGQAM